MITESNFQCLPIPPSKSKSVPYVEIVEQPAPNAIRFRYECERRSVGCLIGENSTPHYKTYPTIKIHGYRGPAAIVISCVTKDDPPKPHPHSVVGKDSCDNGICSMKVNVQNGLVSFVNLGIQCAKKKEVKSALELRKQENIDPFMTGFDHVDVPDSIDFSVIRLCFQVFTQGPDKKFSVPLKPVVTSQIYDKKAIEELIICKLSHCSAPVSGGQEVVLLCGKINKDDIQIRFFEIRDNWVFWESFGRFQPFHVHKQVAIAFKTPAYCNQDITEPVSVQIQLMKKSDGSVSKPVPFQMIPLDVGNVHTLKRKRMRFDKDPKSYVFRQVQAQSDKEGAMVNKALLYNLISPKIDENSVPPAAGVEPKPSAIFQGTASAQAANSTYANNGILEDTRDFNIPFNLQGHPVEHGAQALPETSVSQPRTIIQLNGPSQSPNRPLLTRRRMEPPPPNVTINTNVFRDTISARLCQQEINRYPRYSNQPVEMEVNNDDPFELSKLPCNLNQLSPQDLAVLGTINSDDISENLSENLSRGLSISDQIEDTLRNIQQLNKDVKATQQQQDNVFRHNGRREHSAEPSYNLASRQFYENHMEQAAVRFFS